MRIIITGDRNWYSTELARRVLGRLVARYGREITIVHGAAPGVDQSFANVCEAIGLAHEPHPADWDRLGRKAGPVRNAEMIETGAGLCLAFHRNLERSKGTRDCVRRAIAAGIPAWLVDSENGEPKRIEAV